MVLFGISCDVLFRICIHRLLLAYHIISSPATSRVHDQKLLYHITTDLQVISHESRAYITPTHEMGSNSH